MARFSVDSHIAGDRDQAVSLAIQLQPEWDPTPTGGLGFERNGAWRNREHANQVLAAPDDVGAANCDRRGMK